LKKTENSYWKKKINANCAMLTDLTGMIESDLECEKLTTETSMS